MFCGDRVSRLLKMFFIIQAYPGLTAAQLSERCGVSQRQCFRDLRTLQDAGVPLYNDRGYRLIEGSVLKEVTFTLEEALALVYGLKLIEQQKELIRTPDKLKEKLLYLLPKSLSNQIESIDQRVEIAVAPAVDYTGKQKIFRELNKSIKTNSLLQMEYYSFSRDELTSRTVAPYQLVFKDGFWYLVAFCDLRQEVRLFRVDRINQLTVSKQKFSPPSDFDFKKYMGAAWQMERGQEFTFKLRFFGESVRFVKETIFHSSQKIMEEPDGSLIFTARASGQRSVIRWILSFGDEVEVLEPVELRNIVGEIFLVGARRHLKDINLQKGKQTDVR